MMLILYTSCCVGLFTHNSLKDTFSENKNIFANRYLLFILNNQLHLQENNNTYSVNLIQIIMNTL